jgi:hypothetical protein
MFPSIKDFTQYSFAAESFSGNRLVGKKLPESFGIQRFIAVFTLSHNMCK